MNKLIIKTSPHLNAGDTIAGIMRAVVLALMPAVAMSIYFFGIGAVSVYLSCIIAALGAEALCLRLRSQPMHHLRDGSALVTGLLTAMILPPGSAFYVGVVASVFAIAIVKHCFGGLGHNIWNPALAGRVFVQFAYPAEVNLSLWPAPRPLFGAASDALTQASPLVERVDSYLELFLGSGVAGSLGETCKAALLLGGIYLIVRGIIDWRVPLVYIAAVFALTALLPSASGEAGADPLYQVLSGGLFLGAFFMATDMVTSPVTARGRAIFAAGCGILVAVIRLYGGYPEGVAYSILLMNTLVPLIDRWCRPRVYGSGARGSRSGESGG